MKKFILSAILLSSLATVFGCPTTNSATPSASPSASDSASPAPTVSPSV